MHRAKKSLGQNFLKGEFALQKIVAAGEVQPTDTILEIGPGKGALTEKILARTSPAQGGTGQVIAVEKDRELCEMLKEKFSKEISEGKLILVEDDILNFEIEKFSVVGGYKIIANIPYNITGAILKKFLTRDVQPERMVLLVQKEVAQRIVATDGKESILSISVKAYGTPKMVTKVPARYFSPAPKVDSAVIVISEISRKMFEKDTAREEKFWQIVKAGFAHKRKVLKSNLKEVVTAENLEPFATKRAENLRVSDWFSLSS